jgi:hypothetical protein
MKRFVEGVDRSQSTLFPECLEDWIVEDNPVRVIDVFVDELDLAELEFSGVDPEMTGRLYLTTRTKKMDWSCAATGPTPARAAPSSPAAPPPRSTDHPVGA